MVSTKNSVRSRCAVCNALPKHKRHGYYLAAYPGHGSICWACVARLNHRIVLAIAASQDRERFKRDETWSLYDGAMT